MRSTREALSRSSTPCLRGAGSTVELRPWFLASSDPGDDNGVILDARIIPPTSQNQKIIESDLKNLAADYLDLSDDDLTWKCEQAVRADGA